MDIVISIPSYFNDGQRQATKDAGSIAGFNNVHLINETAAVAISFGLGNNLKNQKLEHKILVLDLGACTLSVSIVEIQGELYEVKSISDNNSLGGEDFNHKMVEYFANRFQEKFKLDLTKSSQSLQKFESSCERARIKLSSGKNASIICDSLFEGHDFIDKISRNKFEEINDDLFESIKNEIASAL